MSLRLVLRDFAGDGAHGVLGLLRCWPNLKVIAHHMGAMVPYLEVRVGLGLDQLGTREGAEDSYRKIVADMRAKGKRPVDYFRQFLADTATNGSRSGMECGVSFFGIDHWLFGTDCPFWSGRWGGLHPRDYQGDRRHEFARR